MKQEYIIIASLLLLFFLIWKEIKRPVRAHLALRLAASVLAVVALACMIVPITYSVSASRSPFNEIVLLTTGSPKEIPAAYKNSRKITTDPSLASTAINFIPDLSVFLSTHPDISNLHILGNGITDSEWERITARQIRVSYQAPSLPSGFVKAGWPHVIRHGDKLDVYGTYHNMENDSIKIVLTGLGTAMDSTIIHEDSSQHFQLHCLPAHTGATVYELQAFKGNKLVAEEKVPVNILPGSRTRILFLSSSPGFENKFLASWLYQNNYPAAVRNTVSQGKYEQQFLNLPAVGLQHINSSLLENFDVLIADDLALAALGSNEAAAVRAQLNKGMGLILQTDSAASLSSFSRSFSIKKQAVQHASTRSLVLPGPVTKTRSLPAEQWFSISHDPYAQPLVTDEQAAVIVSSRLSGEGKIILNTAAYTYSWILSGNEENYSAFWSLLINKASRQVKPQSKWQQSVAFPTVDMPAGIVLETASDQPPIIKTDAGELYTTQTPYLPDTWMATWWPVHAGWQTLSGSDTVNMYVFEKGDWYSAKASELISRNTVHAAQYKSAIEKQSEVGQQKKRVPVFIFYIAFLAACTYLWWEGKRA
ncbi:MAG TPA: hypothetical protein VHN59_13185 [Chitinophagaceae bacterium]|nr:hypothetical protein [Chitinophagaceae bacterium]